MNIWSRPPLVVAGTVVTGTACLVHPAALTAGLHLASVEDLAIVTELAAVEDPTAVEDLATVENPTAVVVPYVVAASKLEAGPARIPGVA